MAARGPGTTGLPAPSPPGLVVRGSRFSHAQTLDRLIAAIAAHGATLFAVIDHTANAATVGLELPPTSVLIFGNPAVGTPVMLAAPSLALDLPSRILVRSTVNRTVDVIYLDPAELAERHGLAGDDVTGLAGLVRIVDDVLR